MRPPLFIRTWHDDVEIGDPIQVKGTPLQEMIATLLDRTFDAKGEDLVPNYVEVSEKMLDGAYGGRVHFLLALGDVAAHLGCVLEETDSQLWSDIHNEDREER